MVELRRGYLAAVREASNAQDLHESVQRAIELEFSTVPPYLTAMLSLRPDTNGAIWDVLHSVVLDEMLHFAIDCNLLVALGGAPMIDSPAFIPDYPGPLPMAIGSALTVGCEPFSVGLVEKMFMGIDKPERPLSLPAAAAVPATIGAFYDALKDKIVELGDNAFRGDDDGQLVDEQWFPRTRMFPIVDVDSALMALDLIVVEGEGTTTSPEGDPGVIAHYYRFQQIVKGRRLIRDPGVPEGFSFTGAPLPFDEAGVWPITANQKLRDLDADSQGGRRARQFAYSFTKLLKALHLTFNGQPEHFRSAMSLMFELKLAGQMLCAAPAVYAGQLTGRNAGPSFEYVEQNK
jgi:hypothetical protein